MDMNARPSAGFDLLNRDTGEFEAEFEEFVRVALRRVNGEFKSIAADARGNAHRLGQAVESGQIPIHAVLARAQECSRQFGVALPAGYVKLAAASGQKQDYAALERHCTGLLNDYERSFPDPAGFAATMHALPGPEGDFHAEQVLGPLSWYRSEAEKAGCPGNLVSLMRRGNEKLSNLSKTARSLGSSQQALRQEIEELEFLKSMNR